LRASEWPHEMVALTTHDTKRGEDVRARIGVLSQVPSLWAELVGKWALAAPPPDAATGLFLLQNMFGVWPVDGAIGDELRVRLHAYAEKAIREAASHTTWNDPNEEFEDAVHTWIDVVLDGPIGTEMTSLVARLDLHARSDALGQKLIALTAPGVPDVYQGTELWEDSLVDPDNRRPVNYATRAKALEALRHPKIRIVSAALRLRRDRAASFTDGAYTPLGADGPAADHLVAFLRGDDVLTAVSRHTVLLSEIGWGNTAVVLPDGQWTDRISGAGFSGQVLAVELFAELPVALLERTDG
jgi:(1->4)-alpha-D-glucan 1-alpha-D-glucosylmutase